MGSKQLDLTQNNSDIIDHSYLDVYDPVLLPSVEKEIYLLELGIFKP
jgi:hypothetical protein